MLNLIKTRREIVLMIGISTNEIVFESGIQFSAKG